MNSNNANAQIYRQKVELLLRLMPIVMEEGVFAVHGGTAIHLFLMDLPRMSFDLYLTYFPLSAQDQSLGDSNLKLKSISEKAKKTFKGMHSVPKYDICKLLCEYRGKQVKVEVNQTKRGLVGGEAITMPLSDKAQEEFGLYCEAKIVPLTQLYGGKIAAALSRQHPRDLFDVKHMELAMEDCREGRIFNVLGSDRPIHESFSPRLIDQREAMANQFDGMTDIPFTYEEFEETRTKLITEVNRLMTDDDKRFLVSFELGEPKWNGYEFEYFKDYPSVKWKLVNLAKLAKQNPQKLKDEAAKLKVLFDVE